MAEHKHAAAEAYAVFVKLPENCQKVAMDILYVFSRCIPDYLEPQLRAILQESSYGSDLTLKISDDEELLRGDIANSRGFLLNESGDIEFEDYLEIRSSYRGSKSAV
ncbi:MAG: hypothetical protein ACAI44_15785, partial [Candidatus Sericytochromatia bacterium]